LSRALLRSEVATGEFIADPWQNFFGVKGVGG